MSDATPGTQRTRGLAYAALVVVLFSSFVLVSRMGLATALTLPDVAALRFGISGLLMSPVLLRHGLSGLRWPQALTLGVLGGLGFALFAYAGFALAPAAHGSMLLHGTLVLTTAILLRALYARPIARRQGLALAAIALGVAVLGWDGARQASLAQLAGDLCLLGASFCWSGYGLYVKRLGLPAVQAAAIVAGVSALVFLPVYACLPGTALLEAGWPDVLTQGLFQGVLMGIVSVFIYTRAVALLGAEDVAMCIALVPALTTAGGYVLLAEVPNAATLAGLALITAGMAAGLRRSG